MTGEYSSGEDTEIVPEFTRRKSEMYACDQEIILYSFLVGASATMKYQDYGSMYTYVTSLKRCYYDEPYIICIFSALLDNCEGALDFFNAYYLLQSIYFTASPPDPVPLLHTS